MGNRRKGLLVLRKSGKGKNEAWRPVVFEAPLSGNVQTAAALYGLYVEPLSQMVFERVANLGETLIKSSPLLIALGIVSAGIFFLTQ